MTPSPRNEQPFHLPPTPRDPFKTAGNVLILLGVSVWCVYAVLRWGLGWDLTLERFLTLHLLGVIPGSILRHWHRVRGWFR